MADRASSEVAGAIRATRLVMAHVFVDPDTDHDARLDEERPGSRAAPPS